MTKLVKMLNEEKNILADVHPSEVKNYLKGGYLPYEGNPVDPAPVAVVLTDTPPPPAAVNIPTAAAMTAHNATDEAVQLAADAGLDLASVQGTGKNGKITVKDVESAIDNLTAPSTGQGVE